MLSSAAVQAGSAFAGTYRETGIEYNQLKSQEDSKLTQSYNSINATGRGAMLPTTGYGLQHSGAIHTDEDSAGVSSVSALKAEEDLKEIGRTTVTAKWNEKAGGWYTWNWSANNPGWNYTGQFVKGGRPIQYSRPEGRYTGQHGRPGGAPWGPRKDGYVSSISNQSDSIMNTIAAVSATNNIRSGNDEYKSRENSFLNGLVNYDKATNQNHFLSETISLQSIPSTSYDLYSAIKDGFVGGYAAKTVYMSNGVSILSEHRKTLNAGFEIVTDSKTGLVIGHQYLGSQLDNTKPFNLIANGKQFWSGAKDATNMSAALSIAGTSLQYGVYNLNGESVNPGGDNWRNFSVDAGLDWNKAIAAGAMGGGTTVWLGSVVPGIVMVLHLVSAF